MKNKKSFQWNKKRSRQLFIVLMLAWPVLHFIFTWALNFNMILMAFKDYTIDSSGIFVGWENFKGVFRLYETENNLFHEWHAVKNTLTLVPLILLINVPVSMIFSYLLYTRVSGYKVWQVLLYIPCITSAIVLILVFRSFVTGGPLNTILNQIGKGDWIPNEGWLGDKFAWPMLLIFSVWTGFSSNMVYFLSAMRRIPADFVEAAKIDGATEYQVFFKIVVPLSAPTVCTLINLNLAGIIGWATPAFLMMDSMAGISYTGTIGLSLMNWANSRQFGTAAAYGMLVTVIVAPILLTVRRWTEKLTERIEG